MPTRRRLPLLQAVTVVAAPPAIPVAGEWSLSVVDPTRNRVSVVTCFERILGGAPRQTS